MSTSNHNLPYTTTQKKSHKNNLLIMYVYITTYKKQINLIYIYFGFFCFNTSRLFIYFGFFYPLMMFGHIVTLEIPYYLKAQFYFLI